jgi:hypothetical protein
MTVNQSHLLERLAQADLTLSQQRRLLALVTDVLKHAIDIRAPKNRPPGKAGLRAEKGYYRLLYLESDFQEQLNSQAPANDWEVLSVMLRQLKDIPELQAEISQGIEAALSTVAQDRTAPSSGA